MRIPALGRGFGSCLLWLVVCTGAGLTTVPATQRNGYVGFALLGVLAAVFAGKMQHRMNQAVWFALFCSTVPLAIAGVLFSLGLADLTIVIGLYLFALVVTTGSVASDERPKMTTRADAMHSYEYDDRRQRSIDSSQDR